MTYEFLLLEKADGVATLTLNRPDRLNAWNTQMREEMRDAVRELVEDAPPKNMDCVDVIPMASVVELVVPTKSRKALIGPKFAVDDGSPNVPAAGKSGMPAFDKNVRTSSSVA